MRGPAKVVTDVSIRERVRRVPPDMPHRVKAKQLVEQGEMLEALQLLIDNNDASYKHMLAYKKWLDSVNSLV